MKSTATIRLGRRPLVLSVSLGLLFALAIAPAAKGDAPIDPLPAPDYSFDLLSCAVDGGFVQAGDVLNLNILDPNVVVFSEMLGLLTPDDDLDALSADNASVTPSDTFALLFSVTPATIGVTPPDPTLIELHVPHNTQNQALFGHAGGDQFMSTHLFTHTQSMGGAISNNVLTRNNYDEGGTDFAAQPPTSASEPAAAEAPLDNVNATAGLPRLLNEIVNVYFSVAADSPSLDTLPSWGYPSPADIYFNQTPLAYAPTGLYASHENLQLLQDDDIDGLIVFDTNQSVQFDETDVVLFSLTPGSPSLDTIPGASPQGAAADVFLVTPGQPPTLFAAAANLGLGHPQDDIDALDFCPCDDTLVCAALHGIRSVLGDLDGDCDVDIADLARLLAAYDTCDGDQNYDLVADIDHDGCVTLTDLGTLLAAYGTTCY